VKSQDILPVLASIAIIILIAVIEKQSKFAAAITAVMPIGSTLALWIVYASNEGDKRTMDLFGQGLLIGLLPTVGFLIVTWLALRAGMKLGPVLLMGYAVWGVGVGLTFLVRRLVGV
jgi:hypothetical protein